MKISENFYKALEKSVLFLLFYKSNLWWVSGKNGLGRKPPPENFSQENCYPEKCPPPPLFAPVKIVLQLFLFKFFIVTSFKGVSSTLALSIMDLLLDSILDVAVVVDLPLPLRFASNKLVEFIRYRFSKAYISNNYRKDVISNE